MPNERITLVLDDEEAAALHRAAHADLRRPREHARYLLRLALLDAARVTGAPLGNCIDSTNGKRAAEAVEADGALAE
jgi:hypothetical protein